MSRQTGYRLQVTGLPQSASWQDLKDTCRRYGDVTFTQVRHASSQDHALCYTPGSIVHDMLSNAHAEARSTPSCRAGDAGQSRQGDRHCRFRNKGVLAAVDVAKHLLRHVLMGLPNATREFFAICQAAPTVIVNPYACVLPVGRYEIRPTQAR